MMPEDYDYNQVPTRTLCFLFDRGVVELHTFLPKSDPDLE